MLWWALLLGLSSLTRYEPAAWSAAIDLDASELAVPLEQVLEIAEDRLPTRILESLRGC
ncbi:YaaC family protein [Amycolatopsis roodepoortensis]|uniref:YaaC family protein n=1 Tax=Amycolatopsis roodepoortensis TaxID=700274 RepID=UPI0035312B31